MSLALLAPFGLSALGALALPIVIHLIRRLELTPTRFAALRWIAERTSPQRRFRFERPWLLAIRLLLLALLAMLLARPVVESAAGPSPGWIVVAPGADPVAARADLGNSAAQWHWLAPGFPSMEVGAPADPIPLASLVREVDAALPIGSALTVVVPAEIAGLDGERLHLRHAIDWHVVPGRMASPRLSRAATPVQIAVRHASGDESSLVYLRAAVAAWNVDEPGRYSIDVKPSSAPIGDDVQWLVWLDGQPPAAVSAWIDRSGTAVLTHHAAPRGDALWRDAEGTALASRETSGSGRILALPGGFDPTDLPILLDADFPAMLLAALRGLPVPPTRAAASAAKPTGNPDVGPGDSSAFAHPRPLDPWLVVLISALALLERIVAIRPRPASAA